MAVQKSKKTRSTIGMRRSHHALEMRGALTTDQETGELHLRHHVTPKGYYKGRQIVIKKEKTKVNNTDNE